MSAKLQMIMHDADGWLYALGPWRATIQAEPFEPAWRWKFWNVVAESAATSGKADTWDAAKVIIDRLARASAWKAEDDE